MIKSSLHLAALPALALFTLVGCSSASDGSSQRVTGSTAGTAGSTSGDGTDGTAGTAGQAVPGQLTDEQRGARETVPDGPLVTELDDMGTPAIEACATGTAEANFAPVNMLIMFDRSGSMSDDNKWPSATAALTAFIESPEAADLRMALRFFPDDRPAAGCSMEVCSSQACSEVLVGLDALLAESGAADPQETTLVDAIASTTPNNQGGGGRNGGGAGGTPMYAALDGALMWATAEKDNHPGENMVVIFVTDGMPHGCNEDFNAIANLAAVANSDSDVRTYAIGLAGSSEAQMDQLAAAGGTGSGIFIDNSANAQQELLDALNAIRGQNLSCSFPMPTPEDTTLVVDPELVNVTFTPSSGSPGTLRQVDALDLCESHAAWYYDDPADPKMIHLCAGACDIVQADPGGKVEIVLGCSTCGGLDVNCGDDSVEEPELPPLY